MSDPLGQFMRAERARKQTKLRARVLGETEPEPEADDTPAPPANLDAAARTPRQPSPPTMSDHIRALTLGGTPEDWARERERYE